MNLVRASTKQLSIFNFIFGVKGVGPLVKYFSNRATEEKDEKERGRSMLICNEHYPWEINDFLRFRGILSPDHSQFYYGSLHGNIVSINR
jgi:hypothetical protein